MKRCGKTQAFLLAVILLSFGPAAASNRQSKFVTTRGKNFASPDGKPLLLKGLNLGNWLLPEGYMFKFKIANSPRLINSVISELVGEGEAVEFRTTGAVTVTDFRKQLNIRSIADAF